MFKCVFRIVSLRPFFLNAPQTYILKSKYYDTSLIQLIQHTYSNQNLVTSDSENMTINYFNIFYYNVCFWRVLRNVSLRPFLKAP